MEIMPKNMDILPLCRIKNEFIIDKTQDLTI